MKPLVHDNRWNYHYNHHDLFDPVLIVSIQRLNMKLNLSSMGDPWGKSLLQSVHLLDCIQLELSIILILSFWPFIQVFLSLYIFSLLIIYINDWHGETLMKLFDWLPILLVLQIASSADRDVTIQYHYAAWLILYYIFIWQVDLWPL